VSAPTKLPALVAAALGAAALALAACSKSDAPDEPAWGKQPCAHCAMLLSDRRFAAQVLTEPGDRRYFDDIGCMVLWLEERKPRVTGLWVHDADGNRWLDARLAHYVAGARSPMDFGFEAHASAGVAFQDMHDGVLAKREAAR
jgi:copper chaperone NosL